MKVIAYPADQGGCGFYRLIAACRQLIAQGAEVDYVVDNDPEDRQLQALWRTEGDGTITVVDVVAPDADVVVLQRPLHDKFAGAIPILQAKGVRVVVEIDDDFEHISRRNVAWPMVQPHLSPARNRANLMRACELADLVTVSTPALAAVYGRHGRVRVVPNCVPAEYLLVRQESHDGVWIGWSGSTDTHPDDLQVTGNGVARAVAATGARVAVVGTGKGVRDRLGLREIPLASGWRTLIDYPEALAQFDVGIVPLESSLFNEAKSWLKGLEMAAVGVPFVATPTEQYRALHAEGIGLLAESPRQWEGLVKRLVRDEDFRAEAAWQGRQRAERWTIEANVDRWVDAWSAALSTRAGTLAR